MNRDKQIDEMATDHFVKVDKKEKEKQIKEMAGIIDKCYPNAKITNDFLAKMLYTAGYRKSTDLASEIFEEIEKYLVTGSTFYGQAIHSIGVGTFANIKKKYIGKDTNVPTKESEGEG